MARISQIALTQYPGFHWLTIRKTINFMEEFSDFADEAVHKILTHLDSLQELPAGAPMVCFHNMELETLDVEYGFPVAGSVSGKEDITATHVPTQKVVSAIDLGPYEKQDPTLTELFEWIGENGYEMQGEIYYQYLNDIERPESEFLTMMLVPVK